MQRSGSIRRHIGTNLALLKFWGLWLDDDKKFFETKFYWIYSLFVNFGIGGSFIMGLFMYIFTNFNSLELVAGNAYLALAFSIPFAKSVFYIKGWTLMKKLVTQLDQEEFQPRNKSEENMVFSNFNAHRAINLMYTFTLTLLLPFWLITPFVVHSKEQKLPFSSWYPFDFRDPRYYAVAYVHQALGICYIVINMNLDLITFGFMAFLAAECDILSCRLRNICYGYTMEEELVQHTRHHWKILKFAADANEFLGTLNFVQFALSNLVICMTMFELSFLSASTVLFFIVLQLQLGVSSELLIYCYFGNNVYSKSLNISDALYSMPWIDCSNSFKKKTLFFIMRTQRPIKMLAVNLFPLSLPTFTSIMRSSWSFFAMLHQTQLKRASLQADILSQRH